MSTPKHIRARHSVSLLFGHFVFVTKYRRKLLDRHALELLGTIFRRTAKSIGAEVLEFEGEVDHVHVLIHYPASLCASNVAHRLKDAGSHAVRKWHPVLRKRCPKSLWSPSYFVSSAGGAPLEVIKRYIANQERPTA